MSDLDDLLSTYSGNVNEHESFLTDDEMTEVTTHVQRIYDQFVESVQLATPQGETTPTEAELSAQAMSVAFDIVFNVAYELGQTDAINAGQVSGITVTLDDTTTQVLVQHALRNLLTKEE